MNVRRYHRAMKVRVLYFAVFREKLGRENDVVALHDGALVRDALAALSARHDVIAKLRGKFRVAVNQDFVDDARELADGDELALIPPVAGGVDEAELRGERHVQLLATPLSLDRCIAAVQGAGMGGVATFTGMVRRHSRGPQVARQGADPLPASEAGRAPPPRLAMLVDHLEYEAYGPMAVREMTRLCEEIEAEIPEVRLAVEHRVGRLEVGDVAVVIAAAAPHRAEAFAACRQMIDRLKERVPIWKKEVGDDGAEWIGLGP
jgi:molybdopterin converting factor subunit 1